MGTCESRREAVGASEQELQVIGRQPIQELGRGGGSNSDAPGPSLALHSTLPSLLPPYH